MIFEPDLGMLLSGTRSIAEQAHGDELSLGDVHLRMHHYGRMVSNAPALRHGR